VSANALMTNAEWHVKCCRYQCDVKEDVSRATVTESESFQSYFNTPVSSNKTGSRFQKFDVARQELRCHLNGEPERLVLGLKTVEEVAMGRKKVGKKKRKRNDEDDDGNDHLGTRELNAYTLLPAIVRLLFGALGLEKNTDYTKTDVKEMVNVILREGEDAHLSFSLPAQTDHHLRDNYSLIFWAARHLLDIVECALSFGLLDAVINLLVYEGQNATDNALLVEILASNGYLIHLLAKLATAKATQCSISVQHTALLSSSSDRTSPAAVSFAVKLRFMRDFLRAASMSGLTPTPQFSADFLKTCADFGDILTKEDIRKSDVESYFVLMCNGIDFDDDRLRRAIAASMFKASWSNSKNHINKCSAGLAACIGMLLKTVVFSKGGPFERELLRNTKTTGTIKFFTGFKPSLGGGPDIAEGKPPDCLNDFRLTSKGVVDNIFVLWTNMFRASDAFLLTAIGDSETPNPIVADDAAANFSFDVTSADIFSAGTVPGLKVEMFKNVTTAMAANPELFSEYIPFGGSIYRMTQNALLAIRSSTSPELLEALSPDPEFLRDIAALSHEPYDFDQFVTSLDMDGSDDVKDSTG